MSVPSPSAVRPAWSLAPRSLRWRLQIWHALVLVAILVLFGTYVYHLQWQTRLQETDAELNRTADIISIRLRRLFIPPPPPGPGGPGGPQPPQRNGSSSNGESARREPTQPPPPPLAQTVDQPPRTEGERRGRDRSGEGGNRRDGERREGGGRESAARDGNGRDNAGRDNERRGMPPWPWPWQLGTVGISEDVLNSNESRSPMYFLIWDRDGRLLEKSASAPDVPFPNLRNPDDGFLIRTVRMRGLLREVILVRNFDINVLVGRSIETDIVAHRRHGLVLIGAAGAVLVVGLLGGWGFASRVLRPIQEMSETAASISGSNLSRRISTEEADSELGQLAAVLNDTFDRLQAAFTRQTQFTADASHELRTPVSVILAQTQSSLLKPRSPEEYREALQACRRSALRMKGLIDGLLALARLDAADPPPPRPVPLDDLVRDVASLLAPKAEERRIRIELALEPGTVRGDRERLDQLVTNLLSNAIRYNREDGLVSVSLRTSPDEVVLAVKDTGEGIPAESIPKLFDRFYRVDPARSRQDGGSGLGLSIVKGVVDAHAGAIRIESEVGRGTTVELTLPRGDVGREVGRTEVVEGERVVQESVAKSAAAR
ncbi:sensor histidine kinase [Planctomyces sp. SH-PL14]|uniref:sensor histidine kinase n=1 Tax=Planctomyces sp. SH-PL14 TaxID=1632864 RepID=UPI00078E7E29|nr:ATP-binding protein [Planctomyces sp. SH-PL14]AMV19439.1 Sensor kinase CusS [Planctomyces sp. SH-PL14]